MIEKQFPDVRSMVAALQPSYPVYCARDDVHQVGEGLERNNICGSPSLSVSPALVVKCFYPAHKGFLS